MKRILPLILVVLPSTVWAQSRQVRSSDYYPNPNFKSVQLRDLTVPAVGAVEQEGEVVIIEGDNNTVSTSQTGFGIVTGSLGADNAPNITTQLYTKYGDDFDEIVIFTSFTDTGAQGAAAYEISAQQDVMGLGQDVFDETSLWGSTTGRLHAFVNMMKWNQFAFSGGPALTDPDNYLYAVLGQEFAHRWLAFMQYTDANGQKSQAMLGRDKAHWASTMQAYGSFMDGNVLTLGDDGYYLATDLMTTYSTLDLYGMGLLPPAEVQPWFVLKNAVTNKGAAVDPTQYLPDGAEILGTREDITIDQVISANGARLPSYADAPHDFRIAFALVTYPGQRAGDVVDIARTIDQERKVWEQQFAKYTGGRGSVCTQVSAPCGPIATAHIIGGDIVENGGNHNGVPEPGEPITVTFHLVNDSQVTASSVAVSASGNFVSSAASTTLDQLLPSATADVSFSGTLPPDAVCGQALIIDGASTVGGNTFRGFAETTPGLTTVANDSFEKDRDGWVANPHGDDTAVVNGWAWGTPVGYRGYGGWIFQPSGCHESKRCWFTGLERGHRGLTDSGLEVGTSHLYSKPIDASQVYQPVLSYWAWFQALDITNPMTATDVKGQSMLVEGSTDGGASWTTLDTIDSIEPAWQPRQIAALDTLIDLGAGPLLLRFTVHNDAAMTVVEAGVDDVQVSTLTQACNPDQPAPVMPSTGGCEIAAGARAPVGVVLLWFAVAALLLRRRLGV